MRDNFTKIDKDRLAARVGHKCSNPNCRKITMGPSSNGMTAINVGVAAHVTAADSGGKRFDSNQSSEERKSVKNGIWLCQTCAKLIDSDENKYNIYLLNGWKTLSEQAASLDVENPPTHPYHQTTITAINPINSQIAHTIVNERIQKRSVENFIFSISDKLKEYPPATYRLHYSSSSTEDSQLANGIDKILKQSGWHALHPIQRLAGPQFPRGITIFMLKPEEPIITLLNELYRVMGNKGVAGNVLQDLDNIFKIHGWDPVNLPDNQKGTVIFIGPNPED